MSKDARRRSSRIVHDHKGNARVEWLDVTSDIERPKLEIEGTARSLSIQKDDTFNPYMRIPEGERKRAPGQRPTDLRKLSAWIKMMRSLEEAKKNRDDE